MFVKAFWIITVVAFSTQVNADEWRMDPQKSSIRFHGTQTGNSFSGVFETFSAKIYYNPNQPQDATISANIDIASARTGDSQRDEAMPQKDWFFIKAFPVAIFEAIGFMKVSPNNFETEGKLTLKGVEKQVLLPFTLEINEDMAIAKGSITLNRADFGIGSGPWAAGKWVGLDVQVDIIIKAEKIGASDG